MREMEATIALAIAAPERVVRSTSDPQVDLHYCCCRETLVDDKYLCVAVKLPTNNAFVLTGYLIDSIKLSARVVRRHLKVWFDPEGDISKSPSIQRRGFFVRRRTTK